MTTLQAAEQSHHHRLPPPQPRGRTPCNDDTLRATLVVTSLFSCLSLVKSVSNAASSISKDLIRVHTVSGPTTPQYLLTKLPKIRCSFSINLGVKTQVMFSSIIKQVFRI